MATMTQAHAPGRTIPSRPFAPRAHLTHPFRTRLAAEALEARDVPSASDLGDAAQFNALFFSEMVASNSDAEGRIAVGAHAAINNYGIGEKLLPDNTRDDLVVGAEL